MNPFTTGVITLGVVANGVNGPTQDPRVALGGSIVNDVSSSYVEAQRRRDFTAQAIGAPHPITTSQPK